MNRILVVEDEAIVAMHLCQKLETLRYEVVGKAATTEDACKLADDTNPDLVLMDIHLQDEDDGVETAARIRESLDVPIVFLTAYADPNTIERAKSASPHGYIVKPFDERDLHTTIQIALHQAELDRRLRESHDQLLAILNSQRHGTVMIDAEQNVTFASDAALAMLDVEDAQTKPLNSLLGINESDYSVVLETIAKPADERAKVGPVCRNKGDSTELQQLEIDVRDDPRDAAHKILFLYDVSQLHQLRAMLDDRHRFEKIIGKSNSIQQVFQLIQDIATVNTTVLIEGDTGTGKELVARAIHARSPRSDGPFVALNCAGLTDELASSHLFGHRRGSFTGAVEDRDGLFEAARDGTLFLDEIHQLSINIQAALLRVLEENEITRVGETQARSVNARIIVASNADLSEEVAAGRFRADLLYRIRIARIELPPLHERREDIPLLARSLFADSCLTTGKSLDRISEDTMSILIAYQWPGNVRELKNAMEFAVIHARGTAIRPGDLPTEILEAASTDGVLGDFEGDERGRIVAALERAEGNRKQAAELLGISRATLYRRLAELEIE